MTKSPIGIFDSGYGGLTVLQKIVEVLPEYDFIYLGDNARAPYGTRSFDVVYEYTKQAVEKLFSMGTPLNILACNTASAKALRTIQQKDLPLIAPGKRVLGVIRPSTENISSFTTSNHIGILGTPGTVQSDSYPIEIKNFHPKITVVQEACPMWVPLVENNEFNSPGGDYFIRKHIKSLLKKDEKIDAIILGCTHYPILTDKIKALLPAHIQLINQGDVVAKSLVDYLKRHPEIDEKCSKNGELKFFTTENPISFEEKASIFFKQEVKAEQIVL